MQTVFELQIEYVLSDELMSDVRKSIIENKFKLSQTNVEDLKFMLDDQVQAQLLNEMYENFIRSHKFFTDVSILSLPRLERIIRFIEITDVLYQVNKLATEVYFLIDGKIKLKDKNFYVVAE